MPLHTRPITSVIFTLTATLLPMAATASQPVTTQATSTTGARTATVAAPDPARGWQRYHAQDFTAPAGDLCSFTLHDRVLFDKEYVRTTRTFPNGKPRTEQYVGPLVVRVVNRDSNRGVVRDISGRAVVQYRRDGSFDFAMQGPAAVGFHPGDSMHRGFYVLSGKRVVRFAADGTRTMLKDHGSEENLCKTLS